MDKNFQDIYDKNLQALNQYRFFLNDNLPTEINFDFDITEDYFSYCTNNNATIKIPIDSSTTKQRFFSDLDKQILVKNEFNLFSWQYLYDNVRKSEDYGDDNHIYVL